MNTKNQKTQKQVVKYEDLDWSGDTHPRQVRIQYLTEADGDRVVTTACLWNPESRTLHFAGCIWREDDENQIFNKQQRRQCRTTAIKRLQKNPHVLKVEPGDTRHFSHIARRHFYRHGMRA